jgi:hypothetical protein
VQALDPAARRPIGRWLVPSHVQKPAFAPEMTTTPPRFRKSLLHLQITGLVALRVPLDDWERALIEPALARVLDADDAEATVSGSWRSLTPPS